MSCSFFCLLCLSRPSCSDIALSPLWNESTCRPVREILGPIMHHRSDLEFFALLDLLFSFPSRTTSRRQTLGDKTSEAPRVPAYRKLASWRPILWMHCQVVPHLQPECVRALRPFCMLLEGFQSLGYLNNRPTDLSISSCTLPGLSYAIRFPPPALKSRKQ